MAIRSREAARRPFRPAVWVGVVGLFVVVAAGAAALVLAWVYPRYELPEEAAAPIGRMVRLDGGVFLMGNDRSPRRAERPAHDVRLSPFWIDEHEVTNRQFTAFVAQTGYETTAQRRGWSLVIDRRSGSPTRVAGADWRHPGGPHTTLDGRDDWPVVHVSWFDARAYATWAAKQLPSEAQWEFAARGGLRDGDFPWGREELRGGRYQANYRQGGFPQTARPPDGYDYLGPVRSFPANGFGLFDLSGNVWEWCGNYFSEEEYETGDRVDPAGPSEGTTRVLRGGSWATALDDAAGPTVWVRRQCAPDYTSDDVGFRCVRSPPADRY